MQLSDQQVRFFNTFGYLAMPKVFSAGEIADITAAFETAIQQHGGGDKHDGSKRTMFLDPVDRTPAMNALLDEPWITGLVDSVIGEDFNYCSGDVVIFNHDTYHAAFGGSTRRRMFTMNCVRRAKDDAGFAKLRSYLSAHCPSAYKINTGAGMYWQSLRDTAGADRLSHMEQADRIHDVLHPQFARRAL